MVDMPNPITYIKKRFPRYALAGSAIIILGILASASAQYGGNYPYSRPSTPSRQLPNTARHVGGYFGNPYTNTRSAPTGLPVSGNRHSYFGTTGGRSAFGNQAVAKPFSNLHRPQPLITSREAARLEVARGLWRY